MAVVAKGLEGIIAAETRIGDVRGKEGILIYCGYDINELAGKVSFEETVHLLYHGRLPTATELEQLTTALRAERELPQGVVDYLTSAPEDGQADRCHAHGGEHARDLRYRSGMT